METVAVVLGVAALLAITQESLIAFQMEHLAVLETVLTEAQVLVAVDKAV